MNAGTEMYWALCPMCGGKMLRIQSGMIETICPICKEKWLIIVDNNSLRYEHIGDIKVQNSVQNSA